MGQAIAVRRDYTSGKLRRLAQRTKNAAQTCRLGSVQNLSQCAGRPATSSRCKSDTMKE